MLINITLDLCMLDIARAMLIHEEGSPAVRTPFFI